MTRRHREVVGRAVVGCLAGRADQLLRAEAVDGLVGSVIAGRGQSPLDPRRGAGCRSGPADPALAIGRGRSRLAVVRPRGAGRLIRGIRFLRSGCGCAHTAGGDEASWPNLQISKSARMMARAGAPCQGLWPPPLRGDARRGGARMRAHPRPARASAEARRASCIPASSGARSPRPSPLLAHHSHPARDAQGSGYGGSRGSPSLARPSARTYSVAATERVRPPPT